MRASNNNPTFGAANKNILLRLSDRFSLKTKLCLALIVFPVLLYTNTLWNGYVMDDVTMITENKYVHQGFNGIANVFSSTHTKGFHANEKTEDYRPLSLAMFAAEYQVFGLNPFVGHLLNVVFYAGCVVLLFLFLVRLLGEQNLLVAFVTSLLFAAHPIHTEVVANIKSRDELLCFLFAFLAMNLFMGYARSGKWLALLGGCFSLFLSVLSKETVLTFMLVIPLVFFFYSGATRARSGYITLGASVVFFIFFFIWSFVLSGDSAQQPINSRLINNLSAGSRGTLTYFAPDLLILGYYIRLLFVPYPLCYNYNFSDFAFVSLANVKVVISLLIYLLLGAVAIYRLVKNKRDVWALGILFYLFMISIFSNIFFLLGQPLAERYLFFPSAGFCLVVGQGIHKLFSPGRQGILNNLKSPGVLLLLVPVLLIYSCLSVARNFDWKDNYTLVATDLPKNPNDAVMQYKAGLELQQQYDSEKDSIKREEINMESIKHFLKSIERSPEFTEAHADIGVAYFRENKYDSAEYHFRKVLELNPAHFNATINLATLLLKKQQYNEAISYYLKAIAIDSSADNAWYNLGICYAQTQQLVRAVPCLKKVLVINASLDNYKSFGNVAILYKKLGQLDSAEKYMLLMKQYYPGFNLANY